MGLSFNLGRLSPSLFTDSSLNVGIGAAPSGSYKLEVTGTGRFTGSITAQTGEFLSAGQDGSVGSVVRIGTTNTNAAARNWGIVNSWDNYGDLTFRVSNAQGGNALSAGSTKMVILSSGNVGIGTSSPAAALDIDKAEGIMMRVKRTGVAGEFQMYQGPNVVYLDSAAASGNLAFATVGTERMRITSGGVVEFNVGATKYGKIYGNADPDMVVMGLNGQVIIGINGTEYYGFDTAQFYPNSDGTQKLGTAGNRWSTVYATNGSINTSDKNEKEQIEELNQLEKNVALKLKSLIKKFKFKDAVISKGDEARIHIGVIAQEVEQAFIDEGLDPNKYGLFCSDKFWQLDGRNINKYKEGAIELTRLGIRYDELLAFIISVI